MDKVCPILTARSEFKELCIGVECAWYEKCYPTTVTYTTYDPYAPVHIVIDSVPQQQEYPAVPYIQGYIDSEGVWRPMGGATG